MALTVEASCSHHQKNDGGYGKEVEISLSTISDASGKRLKEMLEQQGWIVQFNGEFMDTYCSKKCAE